MCAMRKRRVEFEGDAPTWMEEEVAAEAEIEYWLITQLSRDENEVEDQFNPGEYVQKYHMDLLNIRNGGVFTKSMKMSSHRRATWTRMFRAIQDVAEDINLDISEPRDILGLVVRVEMVEQPAVNENAEPWYLPVCVEIYEHDDDPVFIPGNLDTWPKLAMAKAAVAAGAMEQAEEYVTDAGKTLDDLGIVIEATPELVASEVAGEVDSEAVTALFAKLVKQENFDPTKPGSLTRVLKATTQLANMVKGENPNTPDDVANEVAKQLHNAVTETG